MTKVEISKRLVAINALSSVLAHLVSVGALLWVNRRLLLVLPEAEYEIYPVVMAFVMFLQIFTSGLTGGIARYVTEAYAKGDPRRVTEIVSSMMPVITAGAMVFVVLGGLAAWQVDSLLRIEAHHVGEARLMIGILVVGHAFVLLAMPFTVGTHVRQRFIWLNVIRLGEQVLRIAILVALLFGVSDRVLWVVVAAQAATLSATVVLVLYSRRLIPELRFERSAFRGDMAKKLTSFGGWTMLGTLVYRIRTSADTLILNKFGAPADVNSFHVGMIPDRQMDVVVATASATLQPALTAMHATDRHVSLVNAYLRGNRYYLWIALAVAAPLIVFAYDLVRLYTNGKYMLAAPVLLLTCVRYPINYATEMLYRVAMAKAQIKGFFIVVTIAGIVHIALAIVLVMVFELGVLGIAASSVGIAIVGQVGFLWPMGLKMLGLTFRRFARETLLPGYMPGLVSGLACWGMSVLVVPSSWLVIFSEVAIGFAVYCVVVLKLAQPEDRRDFGPIFAKFLGRSKATGK